MRIERPVAHRCKRKCPSELADHLAEGFDAASDTLRGDECRPGRAAPAAASEPGRIVVGVPGTAERLHRLRDAQRSGARTPVPARARARRSRVSAAAGRAPHRTPRARRRWRSPRPPRPGSCPTSPTPRTPKGVTGEGTSVCSRSISGTSQIGGREVVHHRAVHELAGPAS